MAGEAERTLARAVRLRVVARYTGELGFVFGISMLVPVVGAAVFGDYGPMAAYAGLGALLVAGGLVARRSPRPPDLQRNEALVVTVAAFVLAPLLVAGPLALHGVGLGDALFEAVSGITTTGLSTLDGLDQRPRTFLLARAWMQWIGGLGFVVLSLAILFDPGVATRRLGAPTLDAADVEGSMRAHARQVLVVYLALTAFGILLLLLLGAGALDAVLHTLSGVSTGGFAPRDSSLADLERRLQCGILGVSALGAVSLPLYAHALRGRWRRLRDDPEVRALLVLIAGMGVLLYAATRSGAGGGPGVADVALLTVSAQTTTGFSTQALEGLPAAAKVLLVLSMLCGGCLGSTAGGVKILRLLLMVRLVRWLVVATRLPAHAVAGPTLKGVRLQPGELMWAGALVLLFVTTLVISWLAFLAYGYPPVDSLFEVASATGTVGLSTGVARADLEPFLKGVLCMNMWAGRLEVFALLVALAPRTWLGRRAS